MTRDLLRAFASLSLLALGAGIAPVADALSCITPAEYRHLSEGQRLQRKMDYADGVFAGRFVHSVVEGDYQISRFDVLRVWKGRVASREDVKYSTSFGDAPDYVVGEIYVVLASGKSGDFQNNLQECDGPMHVEKVAGRHRYPDSLGRGKAPEGPRQGEWLAYDQASPRLRRALQLEPGQFVKACGNLVYDGDRRTAEELPPNSPEIVLADGPSSYYDRRTGELIADCSYWACAHDAQKCEKACRSIKWTCSRD